MSSKGRGERLDPSGDDDYPTPPWAVFRFLEAYTLRAGVWVEPCVGDRSIINAVEFCLKDGFRSRWKAYEINPAKALRDSAGYPHIVEYKTANFLKLGLDSRDLEVTEVITNPPYNKAQAFVEQCSRLYPNANISMLLRLGFLESEARKGLWEAVGVPDVYVLPNRPSFASSTGALKTDSTVYGWLVWHPMTNRERRQGSLQILDYTSLEDRKQWR